MPWCTEPCSVIRSPTPVSRSSSATWSSQHAGADGRLDRLAAARVEDDGVDPLERQEVREQQSGGSPAQDPHLCVHRARRYYAVCRGA